MFENKEQTSFDTYFSYLKSISKCATDSVAEIDNFLDTITKNKAFKKIQTKKDLDLSKISKILRNAWYTEFQMNQLSTTSEFAGFSLHWAQVYAYYSCYLQIRVYLLSQNQIVNPKHLTTLRHFSQELDKRSKIFPHPWNLLCEKNPNDNLFINKKEIYTDIHQLSNLATLNPVDNFSKFLKTTRKREIEKKCNEWKIDNRKKRTPKNIKDKIIQNTPPTSIYDCLYRLRIRANYENADTFIFSQVSDHVASEFHECLKNIVWISSLILETISSKYLSSKNYKLILEDYKKNLENKNIDVNQLEPILRYELIENRIK
ncbi:hypothetical protein QVZ41_14335 [Wenyingzhuangia sp. chi5]|uniref:HEPN domain-containing protein n=1 Tax=Wenyingzhuangia gilva TaxID=3057677 RepID=A0ABT8VVN1_9FLAO|nr:hypothetical protein [Wenyingzhuangia sp. chi5]MDO3696027.1 hypothetical protein [Wenyingzhuangia sp. chi5]